MIRMDSANRVRLQQLTLITKLRTCTFNPVTSIDLPIPQASLEDLVIREKAQII